MKAITFSYYLLLTLIVGYFIGDGIDRLPIPDVAKAASVIWVGCSTGAAFARSYRETTNK